MNKAIILSLLLVVACGKNVMVKEASLPVNNASAIESEELDKALDDIQGEFDRFNVKVNLRSLPYNVNLIEPAMGVCYLNGSRPVGIALDHSIFEMSRGDKESYGLLYKVLLHEIGHCFFNRSHDEARFEVQDKSLFVKFYPSREATVEDFLQVSIMSELGWYTPPKSLWPYYVQEVAGLKRFRTIDDVKEFIEVSVVPKASPLFR